MKSTKLTLMGLVFALFAISSAKNYDVRTLRPYFSIGGEFRNMKGSELWSSMIDDYGVPFKTTWVDANNKVVDTIFVHGTDKDLRNIYQSPYTESPVLGFDLGVIDLGTSSRIELFSMGLEAGVIWEGVQLGFNVQLTEKLESKPSQGTIAYNFEEAIPTVDPVTGDAGDPINQTVAVSTNLWSSTVTISDYVVVMGYELFPEQSFFQLVPRFGLGFSSINIRPPGQFGFTVVGDDDYRLQPFYVQKQDYSALGKTFQFELETQLNFFRRFALSANVGYRYTSFDEIQFTQKDQVYFIRSTGQDSDIDHLFIGAKATFILPSLYEKETGKPIRRQ